MFAKKAKSIEQTENADINFVHYHLGKLDSSNLFVDMTQ